MTLYEENLSKIIQKETVSEVGQTDLTKFYEFHKLLEKLFPLLWKTAAVEDFDANLLIKWPGKNAEKQPVLFMNHFDVVPPNGEWKHDPFGAEIEEGKMYGRGTLDTKTGLWAMLQAAEDAISLGFVPEQDIYFESACNEEITGEGAEKISEVLKERGIRFRYVLDEGMSFCGRTASVGVGEKGITEIKFFVKSAGGHASRPPRNSPLVKLGRFMAAVDDNLEKLFPIAIEPNTGTPQQTTIAFTMAEGSAARNVIPSEAYVIASMRSSHHQTVNGSIKAISEFAKKYDVEMEILDHGFTSLVASTQSDAYIMLSDAIKKCFPGSHIEPFIMPGGTDARYMSKVSDGPLRFTPIKVSPKQHETIHGIDEYVELESLPLAVEFYKYMMMEN